MSTPIKAIIVVVILAIIGVGAWAAVGMGSDNSDQNVNSSTTSTNPYSAPSGNQPSNSVASNQANSGQIIQTKTDANLGSYLADSSGNALYTYDADTPGVSNCTGACLYNWPIYSVVDANASLPANVTVISRSDGSKQYAYKGLPLYTFTSDSPGRVTGDGVENFHVAKP